MGTLHALLPLALALAGPCGLATALGDFDMAHRRTAAPPAPRSGDRHLRLPRLCARDPGETDEQLGITEADRHAIELGRTDLPAALAFIEKNDLPDQQARAKYALIYRLCQNDLGYLAKVPAVFGDPVEPRPFPIPPPATFTIAIDARYALQGIFNYWVAKDHDKIFKAVQDLPPSPLSTHSRILLAPMLASKDFSQAAALVEPLRAHDKSLDLITNVVGNFEGDDFSELLAWTHRLPPSYATGGLVNLARRLNDAHDLDKLQKLALAEPLPKGGAVPFIFGNALGKADPDHVAARVDAFDAPPEKKERILSGAIQTMPAAKTREVASRLLTSSRKQSQEEVFAWWLPRLFAAKREEAIQLVMTSPEDVRGTALQTLVIQWFHADPDGLVDWISRLPKGRDRTLVEDSQRDLARLEKEYQPVRDGSGSHPKER